MAALKAFVGHSFSDRDDMVVRAFQDFLTALSKTIPGFVWDHAKPAEPKLVANKVLALMADRNLFIAICTRNEKAVAENALKALPFTNVLYAPGDDFVWKTSDWVIQEIGLAIGKSLPLIILVEDGVRLPGGLQGDIEHIRFDRSNPHKAFPRILEMITSLSGTLRLTGPR